MATEPVTLKDAIVYFADPDNCLSYLVARRWPNGIVVCPTCGRPNPRYMPERKVWQCSIKHVKRQFSVKIGTIFEDSPLGLDKWLPAVWLISNCKNGISSYEIHRDLGVTQKTAWFMLQRIRLGLQSDGGMLASYNNREDMTKADRFNLAIRQATGKRLTWKELTGKETATQPEAF